MLGIIPFYVEHLFFFLCMTLEFLVEDHSCRQSIRLWTLRLLYNNERLYMRHYNQPKTFTNAYVTILCTSYSGPQFSCSLSLFCGPMKICMEEVFD